MICRAKSVVCVTFEKLKRVRQRRHISNRNSYQKRTLKLWRNHYVGTRYILRRKQTQIMITRVLWFTRIRCLYLQVGCSLFLFVIGKHYYSTLYMFISAFNYLCLMGVSPQQMPRCWHVGGLGKLSTFCLTDREFNQSFLWRFILFPFTKLQILWSNKYVIALTKRKRPPLVRGHHWSPVSTALPVW